MRIGKVRSVATSPLGPRRFLRRAAQGSAWCTKGSGVGSWAWQRQWDERGHRFLFVAPNRSGASTVAHDQKPAARKTTVKKPAAKKPKRNSDGEWDAVDAPTAVVAVVPAPVAKRNDGTFDQKPAARKPTAKKPKRNYYSNSPWSDELDERLLAGIKVHGRSWAKIRDSHLTSMTRLQIRTRAKAFAAKKPGALWSDERDEHLLAGIKVHGRSWAKIRDSHLPSMTGDQLAARADILESRSLRMGRWSDTENETLTVAIAEMGYDWRGIQDTHFPGRALKSVRKRVELYKRKEEAEKEGKSTSSWTKGEKQALLRAVETHGVKDWNKVAGVLKTRTAAQASAMYSDVRAHVCAEPGCYNVPYWSIPGARCSRCVLRVHDVS